MDALIIGFTWIVTALLGWEIADRLSLQDEV
jgi:hypothetical protein